MSKLPIKFTNLEYAQKNGVLVPLMFLINDDALVKQEWSDVEMFLKSTVSEFYIVRSAVSFEDSFDHSQAGVFQSSNRVAANAVISTLKNLYTKNKKRLGNKNDAAVNLIVSPFIKSTCGGVSFYPWLYFNEHALVEFANTPQAAVAGNIDGSMLLDLTDSNKHIRHAGTLSTQIILELQIVLQKLRKLFNYPIDIEWAYDGQNLYVLQIRPITIPPQALAPSPLSKYIKGDYVLNEYSETFGKLSPLSFSILQTLFSNSSHYIDSLQIHGKEKFLTRLNTGNIVSEPTRQSRYFYDKHWYSAFVRGVKSHSISTTLEIEAREYKADKDFSVSRLQYAFDRLQLAEAIAIRNKNNRSTYSTPQEYEVTQDLDSSKYPTDTPSNTWKKLFLETFDPIRQTVRADGLLAFCTLDEFLSQDKSNCQTRYDLEISESIYSAQDQIKNGSKVELIYGAHTEGPLLYIANPESWRGDLPKNSIILTSHIPQTWIQDLPNILGVICIKLSALSHVAITLREYNILTIKVPKEVIKSLHSQKNIDTKNI